MRYATICSLVRLSAEKDAAASPSSYRWRNHLPEHLGNFRAAPLIPSDLLLTEPAKYAYYGNESSWNQDEYLLINATSYKYETEKGAADEHAVLPGYSLRERAEVIFRKGSKSASGAEIGRRRVDEGIRRATGGRPLHLSLLWHTVPFFVHPDHASDDELKALCRVPHYLRQSPAWALGNLDSPYPMHLGDTLIAGKAASLLLATARRPLL